MTTEDQQQEIIRLREIQRRRDDDAMRMEREVQRIREYILFGTWTPRPQDASSQ